ncbi:hypothetical protein SAMN06265337_4064 [Hymenobacter gelipurpurascens]|uniref:Uncharacterized protein n=1 Tax=Hymenobacter gelipurpurascens TaxID=89968 RepID=A0A212UH29_9BACT|nr:hypothetical protein [Hymenobacter gelipurpurascens]SNC77480.1 hypothetical protein SAMN06265337_4064 [Hymenobacter gelipurpurascens]
MPTLLHDLRDLLAFEMLSRHTLDILRHKHGASEGELFSALVQVLREQRKGALTSSVPGYPSRLVCGPNEHVCKHCGEILRKPDAMKHLWQAHDLIVRQQPEQHYTTDIRLAELYHEARASGTEPQWVRSVWEFHQHLVPVPATERRRYLVKQRGYTILAISGQPLNGRYQRQDLNADSRRNGFARCLRGTFLLVPMRT